MAVIQISKIQVRRGLQENLPTLSSGEFGWSVDQRRLYIGNGTLVEGSPVTGVTEIVTTISMGALQSNVSLLETQVSELVTAVGTPQATIALLDNTTANTNVRVASATTNALDYQISRGTDYRIGQLKIAQYNGTAGTAVFEDDYTETANVGVTWGFTANANAVVLQYTTSSTGDNAEFKYYIKSFA
jgi:hypothetical protein